MACPHGNSSPDTCSQCLGIAPRKITFADDRTILINGQPASEKQTLTSYNASANTKIKRCFRCKKAGHRTIDCKENKRG